MGVAHAANPGWLARPECRLRSLTPQWWWFGPPCPFPPAEGELLEVTARGHWGSPRNGKLGYSGSGRRSITATSRACSGVSCLTWSARYGSPYSEHFVTPPFPIFRVRPWRVRELRAALRAACAPHCAFCVPDPVPSSLPRVLDRQRTPARPDLPGDAAVKVHVHCATMRARAGTCCH